MIVTDIYHTFDLTVCQRWKSGGDPRSPFTFLAWIRLSKD